MSLARTPKATSVPSVAAGSSAFSFDVAVTTSDDGAQGQGLAGGDGRPIARVEIRRLVLEDVPEVVGFTNGRHGLLLGVEFLDGSDDGTRLGSQGGAGIGGDVGGDLGLVGASVEERAAHLRLRGAEARNSAVRSGQPAIRQISAIAWASLRACVAAGAGGWRSWHRPRSGSLRSSARTPRAWYRGLQWCWVRSWRSPIDGQWGAASGGGRYALEGEAARGVGGEAASLRCQVRWRTRPAPARSSRRHRPGLRRPRPRRRARPASRPRMASGSRPRTWATWFTKMS